MFAALRFWRCKLRKPAAGRTWPKPLPHRYLGVGTAPLRNTKFSKLEPRDVSAFRDMLGPEGVVTVRSLQTQLAAWTDLFHRMNCMCTTRTGSTTGRATPSWHSDPSQPQKCPKFCHIATKECLRSYHRVEIRVCGSTIHCALDDFGVRPRRG